MPYGDILLDNVFDDVFEKATISIIKSQENSEGPIFEKIFSLPKKIEAGVWGGRSYEQPAPFSGPLRPTWSKIPPISLPPGRYLVKIQVYKGGVISAGSEFCSKGEQLENSFQVLPGRNLILLRICDPQGQVLTKIHQRQSAIK
jgi:hypothetical protein